MKYWYVVYAYKKPSKSLSTKDGVKITESNVCWIFDSEGSSGDGDFPIGPFIVGKEAQLKSEVVLINWVEITEQQFDDYGIS